MNFRFRTAAFAATIALAAALACFGQGNTGSINGEIQDPGGAAIAGANITLTNTGTNEARTTQSSANGEYVFANVVPATYSITVESSGFKKLVRNNVIVALQQAVRVDLTMELGQISESVQVNDAVPLIETATASNGQTIDTQMLTDLPNLGRNPYLMSKLSNNVVPVGDPRWNRFQDQIGSAAISIAGGPIRGNNYLIDGIPVTTSQNLAAIIPSLEATQEMKLQTGTYDATMGRTGGGVFNTIIKSGGNTFHGDIMGYLRNSDMAANNFFNNAAGLPRDTTDFKTWGASLSGPIILPKIYNGRNKTFFSASLESYWDKQPRGNSYGVPNALQRTGDFTGSGLTIYDYRTSHPCSGADCTLNGVTLPTGSIVRDPFAGNAVPQSLINPVAKAMLSTNYFPLPNVSTLVNPDKPNLVRSDTLANRGDQRDFKAEHNVNEKLRLTGSFLYYKSFEPGGNPLGTIAGDSGAYLLYRHVDATAANAIVTLNPTTVATVRFGYNRFPNIYDHVSAGFDPKSLGLPYNSQVQEFPRLTISNANTNVGYSGSQNLNYWSTNFSSSIAKFVGKHSLQAGFDFRSINAGGASYGAAAGTYTFNGVFTQWSPSRSGTGADWADFLLGAPSAGSIQTTTQLYFKVHYYGGYVQDDIRVNSKLTVNAGLRYEFETGISERNNGLAVGFNQTAINPVAAALPPNSGIIPYGQIMFAGQNGNNTYTGNPSKTKFGPRIGAAYVVDSKTTLRGGWGMFYAPTFFGVDTATAPGYVNVTTYNPSNDGNATPGAGLSNPFPSGVIAPAGNSLGALTSIGSTISYVDQNRGAGLVQQFSFDIQRQLPWGIAAQLGYVGSRSRNLLMASTGTAYLAINQVAPQYYSRGSALTSSVANPFYGTPYALGILAGKTVTQAQLLRPFPEYDTVSENISQGSAHYNSLNFRVQKRASNGLTLLATLTYAKNMDNLFASGGAVAFNSGSPTGAQNAYDLKSEWALGAADIPLRQTLGWTYELPFGTGKAFLHNNKVLNYAVGGWSINGTAIFNDGLPLWITQTNSNSVVGTAAQRPNATGISPSVDGSNESKVSGWFNKSAFSLAPQFTFGNLSRNISYRGPGQANVDLSIFKTFTITEKYKGEFRAEALNFLNHPLFSNPNTNFSSSSFGVITTQANLPRSIQLGIRFAF
jgi:hypothetical protein